VVLVPLKKDGMKGRKDKGKEGKRERGRESGRKGGRESPNPKSYMKFRISPGWHKCVEV
jgi:hypothetical protein